MNLFFVDFQASLDLQEATTECKALRQKNMELNAAIQELTTARDDAQQIEKVTSEYGNFCLRPDFLLVTELKLI